jgi:ferric-dicitrate binding protein FerR (iron transport regulator)
MSDRNETKAEDAEIAELLRQAGSRSKPPADMMSEVQAAVHAEWRQVVAEHKRRRLRTIAWAAAAAIGALAVGITLTSQLADAPARPMATLQRADGKVFVAADGNQWNALRGGQRIAVGDFLRSEARAALRLDSGVALRMDRGTTLQVKAADRLALNAGAVYVDSQSGRGGAALVLVTHAGAVHHLGTQYQVRTHMDGIVVSVREGSVRIEHPVSSNTAKAGERLEISTQGSVQRSTLAAFDAQWQWASDIAPPFMIDNQPLSAFLAWVAHETGRALVYESPLAQSTAAGVTLHGSIEGLAPDAALTAVLATTSLQRKGANAAILEIGLGVPTDSNPGAPPVL